MSFPYPPPYLPFLRLHNNGKIDDLQEIIKDLSGHFDHPWDKQKYSR
jgi:hypothetical protein